MTGFSADWLALREPFDHRARDVSVLASVAQHFSNRASLTIVDLACGTGSTRRAMAEHLPHFQNWVLVDNDLGLLARAGATPRSEGCTLRTIPLDLMRDLEVALDGGPDLIVASALLDLVSEEWLERLVLECAVRRLPIYAALTYDGRVTLDPVDPFDRRILGAVNRHQLRDKGFGPALGPGAVDALRACCKAAGYAIREAQSDWVIDEDDCDVQQAMLTGWAQAAREMDDITEGEVAGWLRRRVDLVMAGVGTMRVGHGDAFAYPTAVR
jgi:hypothetical protein